VASLGDAFAAPFLNGYATENAKTDRRRRGKSEGESLWDPLQRLRRHQLLASEREGGSQLKGEGRGRLSSEEKGCGQIGKEIALPGSDGGGKGSTFTATSTS